MAAPLRSLLISNSPVFSQLFLAESVFYGCKNGSRTFSTSFLYTRVVCVTSPKLANASQALNQWQPCRQSTSFLKRLTGKQLWEGVTGVSGAGKKRGRGKRVGRKRATDLNMGQRLGEGRERILWPGLNTPSVKTGEVQTRQHLEPDSERLQRLAELRDSMSLIRHTRLPPLQRGYTGGKFAGQRIGPPDPVGDYVFHGFDSVILQFRLVTNMTGNLGRKMRYGALVVTGNKNGLAGYGLGKAVNARAAIRQAKNRAANNLHFIPLYDNHTVFHNMFSQVHRTKLFIHKKHKGFGLRCHRVLKSICEMMGINNLHCKVEGSTKNVAALTHAFFEALSNQETHQELADRTKYHVVEYRQERGYLPVVVASPQDSEVRDVPLLDEQWELEGAFENYYYDGKIELKRKPKIPFYEYNNFPSWQKKTKEMNRVRNQPNAQLRRAAGLD